MKTIAILTCVLALTGCKDIKDHLNPLGFAPTSLPISLPKSAPIACPTTSGSNIEWEVHFSPNGGAEEYIVYNIGQVKESAYLQGYSFTSTDIANALVAKRDKTVEVILDKSDLTGKGSVIKILLAGKVPVYIDDKHAIAHNKVLLLDRNVTFTGSFNFTHAAEHNNAENSLRLVSPEIYKSYKFNYDFHKAHSYRLEHL